MKRLAFVLVLALFMSPSFPHPAGACGQKFLVASSAGPFAALKQASKPAAILIYRGENVAATSALWDPNLELALERAGHSVEITEDREQFLTIARNKRFDIVMMEKFIK